MDLNYFSFIDIQTCQTTPPPFKTTPPPFRTHKQIKEQYIAAVLSMNGRHVTKYLYIDMCSSGHYLLVE